MPTASTDKVKLYVGKTKGRGKLGPAGKQSVPIKDIWLIRYAVNSNSG